MQRIQAGLARDVAPGAMKGFRAGEKAIFVASIGGKFYAIGNRCTHRGCTLSTGRMEGEVVTCPCHGSRFNVKTGALVRGPAEEPEPSYPVIIEGDRIWVEV